LGESPVLKDRLTMLVMVGRSAGMHSFRIEGDIGSTSQKVLNVCEMSLQISSLGLKKVNLVEIRLGSM